MIFRSQREQSRRRVSGVSSKDFGYPRMTLDGTPLTHRRRSQTTNKTLIRYDT